jgi:hypothetical protein
MLSLHSNDFSPIQGPTSTAVLSQPTCTGQSFWARTVGFTSSWVHINHITPLGCPSQLGLLVSRWATSFRPVFALLGW